MRQKAAHIALGLTVLFVLYLLVRQLPVHRLIIESAKLVHGAGVPGALLTALGMSLLSLLLVPIIPLVVACGWLYGM